MYVHLKTILTPKIKIHQINNISNTFYITCISQHPRLQHLRAESVSAFSRGCQSVPPEIWILKLKLLNERVLLSVLFLQNQRHKCRHLALADFSLAWWTKNVLVFLLKCYIVLKCPKKKSKTDDAKCLHYWLWLYGKRTVLQNSLL